MWVPKGSLEGGAGGRVMPLTSGYKAWFCLFGYQTFITAASTVESLAVVVGRMSLCSLERVLVAPRVSGFGWASLWPSAAPLRTRWGLGNDPSGNWGSRHRLDGQPWCMGRWVQFEGFPREQAGFGEQMWQEEAEPQPRALQPPPWQGSWESRGHLQGRSWRGSPAISRQP